MKLERTRPSRNDSCGRWWSGLKESRALRLRQRKPLRTGGDFEGKDVIYCCLMSFWLFDSFVQVWGKGGEREETGGEIEGHSRGKKARKKEAAFDPRTGYFLLATLAAQRMGSVVGGIPGRCREGRDFFPRSDHGRAERAVDQRQSGETESGIIIRLLGGWPQQKRHYCSSCVPPLAP